MRAARKLLPLRHAADLRSMAFLGAALLLLAGNFTGKITNWLLLNNGFHTAHHIRPSLHWSKLPHFHRSHIAPRMNPSLNHRSLTGLLISRLSRNTTSNAR